MGLFSSKPEDKKAAEDKAVKAYKNAKRALDANTEKDKKAGRHDETPEYYRLNRAVIEAEKNVPWYRR